MQDPIYASWYSIGKKLCKGHESKSDWDDFLTDFDKSKHKLAGGAQLEICLNGVTQSAQLASE